MGRLGHRVGSLPFIFIVTTMRLGMCSKATLCVRVGKDVVEAKAGACRFRAPGYASYLLESGARAGPVLVGYDVEYLCADSGYSRHDGPVSSGVAGGV